ncbi:hypothetical protein NPIL_330921 [Nephila pilipes]|uniref:Uncharacterized protein n=1 Tax=Nephila pilipes TaxID=299642 RepID=A0A8X6UCL7_NEPPI|nr:hypothetical protein NPIL_330921 [Nephila pilipes]
MMMLYATTKTSSRMNFSVSKETLESDFLMTLHIISHSLLCPFLKTCISSLSLPRSPTDASIQTPQSSLKRGEVSRKTNIPDQKRVIPLCTMTVTPDGGREINPGVDSGGIAGFITQFEGRPRRRRKV